VSFSSTTSFTRTHARDIASKIGADLRQMHYHYGEPSLSKIDDYLIEIIELLVAGYLKTFEDGWKTSDGHRVVSVHYRVRADGTLADDRSGRVFAGADVSNATHFNFVTYTDAFNSLSPAQQTAFKATLPHQRTPADEPTDGNGYWIRDRSYSSGGVGAERGMFRPS
jgi:hypothetical protein